MNNEIIEVPKDEQENIPDRSIVLSDDLVTKATAKETLADLKNRYSGLKISGVQDKAGAKAVDAARKHIKSERLAIVNRGKALIKPAEDFVKTFKTKLNEVEDEFKAEELLLENKYSEHQKAVQEAEDAIIQSRIDQMAEFRVKLTLAAAREYNVKTFAEALVKAEENYIAAQEEEKRKAAEAVEPEIVLNQDLIQIDPIPEPEIEVSPAPEYTEVAPIPVNDEQETGSTSYSPEDFDSESLSCDTTGVPNDKEKLQTVRLRLEDAMQVELESDQAQRILFQVKLLVKKAQDYITEKIISLP